MEGLVVGLHAEPVHSGQPDRGAGAVDDLVAAGVQVAGAGAGRGDRRSGGRGERRPAPAAAVTAAISPPASAVALRLRDMCQNSVHVVTRRPVGGAAVAVCPAPSSGGNAEIGRRQVTRWAPRPGSAREDARIKLRDARIGAMRNGMAAHVMVSPRLPGAMAQSDCLREPVCCAAALAPPIILTSVDGLRQRAPASANRGRTLLIGHARRAPAVPLRSGRGPFVTSPPALRAGCQRV